MPGPSTCVLRILRTSKSESNLRVLPDSGPSELHADQTRILNSPATFPVALAPLTCQASALAEHTEYISFVLCKWCARNLAAQGYALQHTVHMRLGTEREIRESSAMRR